MAVLNFPYTCMYASCERRPSGFATSSDLEIHTMSVHGNLFTRCRPHYFAKNYKQGNIEWQGIDHFDPFENQVSSMHPHESMDMRRIKRSNASFLAKLVAKHSQMSSSADQVDPSPSPPSQPFSAPVINIQHIRGGRDASVPQGVILPEPSNAGPSLNDTTTALPSVGGIDLARSKVIRRRGRGGLQHPPGPHCSNSPSSDPFLWKKWAQWTILSEEGGGWEGGAIGSGHSLRIGGAPTKRSKLDSVAGPAPQIPSSKSLKEEETLTGMI